jgi:sugar phosphate isomerase/epimerase
MFLTYCLNVHPGERWADNFAALRGVVLRVRDLVSPGRPFGLGLRLSAAAAEELAAPERIEELRKFLAEENLFVFTVNAFPYGQFHGGPVKENVYAPDWRSGLRRDYTNRVADILAALIPAKSIGTISTSPGSWKAWIGSPEDLRPIVEHLADCAAHCVGIAAATSREIVLAIEPEPGCLLETTAETVAFFRDELFGRGAELLAGKIGCSSADGRELLRRYIGVCLDTCHTALQFEDPGESLCAYAAEGIRVPKIQVSSALRTDGSAEALDALRGFVEPVYLHQTIARGSDGGLLRWSDLPVALEDLRGASVEEVRVHFHVPLHFEREGVLGSTSQLITPEFLSQALKAVPDVHLEIETYTWHVLPERLRSSSIERSIALEFEWLDARLRK